MIRVTSFHQNSKRSECSVYVSSHSPFQLYCESNAQFSSHANWALCNLLLPAMSLGEDLHIEGPISPTLMHRLNIIQDIYLAWRPEYKRIQVTATEIEEEPAGEGVGLFFSGGVDSLYSLVKHRDQITHLILVHGFDVEISDQNSFQACQDGAEKIADQLEKKLYVVRTNIREFSNQYCGWGIFHGGALAAVSSILTPLLRKTIIGSSYTYGQLHPWGSHPLLDPLWSTGSLEIVHDGAESNRVQKTRKLGEHPWSLQYLRVCWEEASAYNCGRCEKCLRTMIGLNIAGKLENCSVLPHQIDLRNVRHQELTSGSAIFWEEFEGQIQQADLAAAVRVAIKNYRRGIPPDLGTPYSKARRAKTTVKNIMKVMTG